MKKLVLLLASISFLLTKPQRVEAAQIQFGYADNVYANPLSYGPETESAFASINLDHNWSEAKDLWQWSSQISSNVYFEEFDASTWLISTNLTQLKVKESGDQIATSFAYNLQDNPTVFRERDPQQSLSGTYKILKATECFDHIYTLSLSLLDHFEEARANFSPISLQNPLYEDDHVSLTLAYSPKYYLNDNADHLLNFNLSTNYRAYRDRFARLTNGFIDAERSGRKAQYLAFNTGLGYEYDSTSFPIKFDYTLSKDLDLAFRAEDRWKHQAATSIEKTIASKLTLKTGGGIQYSKYDNWLFSLNNNETLWTLSWNVHGAINWKVTEQSVIEFRYESNNEESKFKDDELRSQKILVSYEIATF